MTDALNQGWYDQNADRSYPFVDDASRASVDGFVLPNDLLVDARLTAPANMDPSRFHVLEIVAFGTGLVLTIGHNGVAVGTVTIPTSQIIGYPSYRVSPLPGYEDVGGTLVVGGSAGVLAASTGQYQFTMLATQFIPTLVFDAQTGVTSLTIIDPLGVEHRFIGAVKLVGGDNVTVAPGNTGEIVLTLVPGVVRDDPCPCTDEQGNARKAVRSINGATPDAAGNILLSPGVGCLAVTPQGSGTIQVDDTCAQPCCGDPEVRQLAESTRTNNQHIGALGNKVSELEAALRDVERAGMR